MRLIHHIARFIVASNIFISLCAISISLSTYLILQQQISAETLVLVSFIFFSCLMVYNITKIPMPGDDSSIREEIQRNYRMLALIPFSMGALVVLSFFLPGRILLFTAHLGLLSLFYVLPIRYKGREYSIRRIPLVKIFVLSYVWAGVTAGLPAIQMGMSYDMQFACIMLERFLFIFALAIPFDIRDYTTDKSKGLLTLPGLIGVSNSIRVNHVVLFLFVLFSFCVYGIDNVSFSRLISGVVALLLIRLFLKRCDRSTYYMFDGIMIVHLVIVAVFKTLH